ncbi:putative O-antigen polymerase [Metapseudomonas resinovorans NBRC 106553]|uniref:Putative O-antigen polymerase n=1 Tax=Metapseudomonas resinovorans NBRC 106553 TaxID=1245471 RepID=S6AJJ9_METRE|nr:putative O-antigen polymerase [Pseudomonas resinovorans NBRC 106553]
MGVWLSRFAVVGVLFLLFGPWVLPNNSFYHRAIIFFLWLPAFVHFCLFRKGYPPIHKLFFWLYIAISAWYIFVLLMTIDGWEDAREFKLPFYVAFSLLGILVAAMHLKERFRDFLLLCGVLGGLAAGVTCLYVYWVQGHFLGYRVASLGVWRVVIPVAQACGALAILTAMLWLEIRRGASVIVVVLIALLGYLVFLYFNQSRWVWLCLVLSFLGTGVLLRNRAAYVMAAMSVLLLIVVVFVKPTLLLSRGLSYRPELWLGGLSLLLDNWVHGVGFQEYWIKVATLKVGSRHPHNMFLDIGIRFGVLGLLLWIGLWCWAGWRAFTHRHSAMGEAAVGLWLYSGLVVLTEGIAPWVKPSPIWFVTWLPLALVLVIDTLARQGKLGGAASTPTPGGPPSV